MTTIRVVAIVEAYTVTGPAKNLIRFARLARNPHPSLPRIEIHIVTYVRAPVAGTNPFIKAVEAAGIAYTVVTESGAGDWTLLEKLQQAVSQATPDIVQTHSVKSHFLFRLAGLHRRYPWLAFHHGYTNENRKVRLYNQLDRWSLRAASRMVTVCTAFASELQGKGVPGANITVIPNSIESSAGGMQNPTPVLGLAPDANIILHIGRFSSEKNHTGLLDAFNLVSSRQPQLEAHLVLVGEGVAKADIEARASMSPHAGKIHFAGQQPDVWPYLKQAKVFALPSLSEGSPNVILEAMVAGLPIVATNVGGIPDLVPHAEAALLTAPGDTPGLAAALEKLLVDRDLAQRLAGGALARLPQFTPETHRSRLTAVYESMLPARAATAARNSPPTTRQS